LRDELGITILLIEHQMRVGDGHFELIHSAGLRRKIAGGIAQEIQGNPNRDRGLPWEGERA